MAKIDPEDLIDSPEVAKIIGLTNANGVSVYRKRASAGFPTPVVDKGRCVLWRRQDVEAWAHTRGKTT